MIFVDTNVFMYAVGRPHPLQPEAQAFFLASVEARSQLVTSAEVLQELLHAYLPVRRLETLEAAWALIQGQIDTVWDVSREDVELARALVPSHPQLSARDLLHLASCKRRKVLEIQSFDGTLVAALRGSIGSST